MQSINATSIRWPWPVRPRCLDRGEAEDSSEHIRDEDSAGCRPIPVPGISHQRAIEAALGMNDHGIGRPLRGRTGLPVARDRAINQARIDLAQRLVAEAEAIHHARTEILDQYV